MTCRRTMVFGLSILCCVVAFGKDKKKAILPADVLQAQTVLVVIDPDAGDAIDAPMANRDARDNVERALRSWGRFRLTISVVDADLVISVRKGNGKFAQPTIGGIPDDRPVILQPSPGDPRVGAQRGTPPPLTDPARNPSRGPHPQSEIGDSEDTFLVYRGQRRNPLDAPPVWRYTGKNALRSPGLPAVDEFRKAIVEAERQANNP